MVLGKRPVPGRPTIWITVRQGPTALGVGAGGGCLDIFTLIYLFLCYFSPSLWETARYRQKFCLKGPLNRKQPTNYGLVAKGNNQICLLTSAYNINNKLIFINIFLKVQESWHRHKFWPKQSKSIITRKCFCETLCPNHLLAFKEGSSMNA